VAEIIFTETDRPDLRGIHYRAELNEEATERFLSYAAIEYANFSAVELIKNDMRDQLQGTGIYARVKC